MYISPFLELPSEVILHILETLRIPDIHAFRGVCRHFDAVIKENASAVYRLAAIVHGYIQRPRYSSFNGELLEQAIQALYGNKTDTTITCWLDFCKTRWRIDQAWKRPIFPNETILFSHPDWSLQRLCHEGDNLLLCTDRRRGFGAMSAHEPNLSTNGARQVDWNTNGNPFSDGGLQPDGELVLAHRGYLLFKLGVTRFRVWRHTGGGIPVGQGVPTFESFLASLQLDDGPPTASASTSESISDSAPTSNSDSESEPVPTHTHTRAFYSAGLSVVGDIRLDARQNAMRLKDGWLMISTERNTLYIFDLAASETFAEPVVDGASPSPPVLIPNSTANLWTVRTPAQALQAAAAMAAGEQQEGPTDRTNVGYTTNIDFSDRYIVHSTSERVRILSRDAPHAILYNLHESSWYKVASGRWAKCITPNAYHLPPPARRVNQNPRTLVRTEEDLRVHEVVRVERGTGQRRKDAPWRWDVGQMVLEGETLVMSFGTGWIVCLPDVERLVSGEWTLEENPEACWVLDIGAPASDVLFDGRRLVWSHYGKICILNLHASEGCMQVTTGTPVVRITQLDWTSVDSSQGMALTQRALWFLGGERGEDWDRTIHLVHWSFDESS